MFVVVIVVVAWKRNHEIEGTRLGSSWFCFRLDVKLTWGDDFPGVRHSENLPTVRKCREGYLSNISLSMRFIGRLDSFCLWLEWKRMLSRLKKRWPVAMVPAQQTCPFSRPSTTSRISRLLYPMAKVERDLGVLRTTMVYCITWNCWACPSSQ